MFLFSSFAQFSTLVRFQAYTDEKSSTVLNLFLWKPGKKRRKAVRVAASEVSDDILAESESGKHRMMLNLSI
jgi:hypothetical protein